MTISQAPAASCVAPCAFAAVRDITGRMLLVRRCDTGDWELPGGHVDPGESASDAAVRETAEESGLTVEVTGLVGIYTDPGHVIADPRAGLVRQPFAVCFHARPLYGSPGGDQVETSDARWFTIGDIPALPIRPAMRLRIDHALTPGAPATSADIGHPRGWPRRPPRGPSSCRKERNKHARPGNLRPARHRDPSRPDQCRHR
jgi:8-oxo-dGTP pyrophosphatase MutT (NUDIX family)